MFKRILADLETPSRELAYEVHSMVVRKTAGSYLPADFVIKSELFGVPQKRHRVILVGIRKDLSSRASELGQLTTLPQVTVGDAISDLPPLRSGISRWSRNQDEARWQEIREIAMARFGDNDLPKSALPESLERGADFINARPKKHPRGPFQDWVTDRRLGGVLHHESRTHMEGDLLRYGFAATFASGFGVSPRLRDFPIDLLPNHANASAASRPFEDRFRVQVSTTQSSTIVSHISKDGHYYIHPDARQMRSLTVREAARLQTFPDNYFFSGNRTSKFHQVGNAVPPFLAFQIAQIVGQFLS